VVGAATGSRQGGRNHDQDFGKLWHQNIRIFEDGQVY
jgi:hypothetical protein